MNFVDRTTARCIVVAIDSPSLALREEQVMDRRTKNELFQWALAVLLVTLGAAVLALGPSAKTVLGDVGDPDPEEAKEQFGCNPAP